MDRWPSHLAPDASRVVLQEFFSSPARTAALVDRVLALSAGEISLLLPQILSQFTSRHRHLETTLRRHGLLALHRAQRTGTGRSARYSRDRLLVLGAYFSNEYSTESAALTNPSLVVHPDQSGLRAGQLRVVVSLRSVGEGHVSSISFATAVLDPRTGPHPEHRRSPCVTASHTTVNPHGDVRGEQVSLLPDGGAAPGLWAAQPADGVPVGHIARFPDDSELSQRVLMPSGHGESHGIEDARFVRFTDDDGTTEYRATYTAFNGRDIAPRLLRSTDLKTFEMSVLRGPAAHNKGMALFPRPIRGRQYALCRTDGVAMDLSSSADGHCWDTPVGLHGPRQSWELVQVGNCGSPIETPAGWLVLTHGVGPMRTYRLGAMLLELDHPERVIAALPGPLLSPGGDERNGYVPNVVYSCGGLIHDGMLWLAYGVSDQRTAFASTDVQALLDQFRPVDAIAG
jgi:predicted GH43/DUF377 family glycosyl hydrolase